MIQSYKKNPALATNYDSIIVGSGMGSLTTAAILAKEGQKVLVLEKHYTAGGFTRVFKRKGFEWDVGIHYIGEVQRPNSVIKKLFDYVSDSKLEWADMGDVYDKIIIGDKEYDFVLFYNNRNIKRKQPSDVIYSYKLFCDSLPKEKSDKCLLLMHTSSVDKNGTDLVAVVNELCVDYDVKFTNEKFDQSKLNRMYNMVDCTINIANNEGFGLTTAESVMSGTPIIVNVTGGLQDQCGFKFEGKHLTEKDYVKIGSLHDKRKWSEDLGLTWGEWVKPVWSSSITLNGSPNTPYIFDDRINHYDVVDSIKEVYEWGRPERKRRGLIGREFMIKHFSNKTMCDSLIKGINNTFKNFKKKPKHQLHKIT